MIFTFFDEALKERNDIMEKVKVFLGGTCASSTWREELQSRLNPERVETFNPVVPNWTPECQAEEDYHRKTDDICLYVITPEGEGFYSFVEVVDDSNKRPESTVACILLEANGKKFEGHMLKCALKTTRLIVKNGVFVARDLDELALFLNSYEKKPSSRSNK
jgi:hypothetical protein